MPSATLVLSGGGARGAFQVGALLALRDAGWSWDRVYGVSVGALNGALVADGRLDELHDVWRTVRERDVYRKVAWWRVALRVLTGARGLYDNRPLRDLIRRHLAGPPAGPCDVGFVELRTGRYVLAPADPDTIYASATMPVIWEPVAGDRVDGGLRNQTPLRDAIDHGATRIITILNRPAGLQPPRGLGNLLDVAQRSLDIALDEIAEEDVQTCAEINHILDQVAGSGTVLVRPDGTPYVRVQLYVLRPAQWIGDTLDFAQDSIRRLIAHGREVAGALEP